MAPTRQECIDCVEQSPSAVASQDREKWLSLFADIAVIEDPVGSHPHVGGLYDRKTARRGKGPLQRFYDAFIGGGTVLFHREKDFVCGLYVMRDLELEPGGIGTRVPMHLLYELIEERGELKVKRLAAHWEVMSTFKSSPDTTSPETPESTESREQASNPFMKMAKNLGLLDTLRWMKCLRSVGEPGKASVKQFFAATNRRDTHAMAALFADAQQAVAWPAHHPLQSIAEFSEKHLTITATKLIAAGSTVTCSLKIDEDNQSRYGVALFDMNRRADGQGIHRIESVKIFVDESNNADVS